MSYDQPSIEPLHLEGKELFEDFAAENLTHFKTSLFFINNSSESVTVLHRNNLSVPLRKTLDHRYPHGDFIVRRTWYFHGNIIMDVRRSIHTTMTKFGLKSFDLELIDKKIKDACQKNPSNPRLTVVIDRVVPVRFLREKGAVYLHEEDLVLSVDDKAHMSLHPYSSEGAVDPAQKEFITSSKVTGFFVEIVDNEKTSGTRFVYTGRRLMEVTPKTDANRKSGVYYHHVNHHPISGEHFEKQYCTLEEAEGTVGLYKTRDEAVSGGNPEIISKTEFEQAKREAAESNRQLEIARHDTAMAQEELRRVQAQRGDYYEERKYQRTDAYDERSAVRKDSSELIKYAAAAIGGALAVAGFLHRQSPKK